MICTSIILLNFESWENGTQWAILRYFFCQLRKGGAWWLSGRASDSGARGQVFKTYLRRVVSLSKTLYSPKVLVIPRKLWLHPGMTDSQKKITVHGCKTNASADKSAFKECAIA